MIQLFDSLKVNFIYLHRYTNIVLTISLLTLPLASTCSAANTTPPQRGHPCPGFAFIEVVSITGARDVLTSLNVKNKHFKLFIE